MPANLVDQLNAEWATLVAHSPVGVREWSRLCQAMSECQSLVDVLPAIRCDADSALGFLLDRYQAGDALAGRTVLQAMLGKLVRMSYTGLAADEPQSLDHLVTQMWCQIGHYPLQSRPQRIAANLALDTLKAAQREWLRSGEIPIAPAAVAARLEDQPVPTPTVDEQDRWTTEYIVGSAYRRGLITRPTHDILLSVYGPDGLTGAAAAQRWHCSPAAVRTRCRVAVTLQLAPLVHRLAA